MLEDDVALLEMPGSDEMTYDDEAIAAKKRDDDNGIIAILIG